MKLTLGTKLKQLRREANLSLRELAAKVEMDFTYLSKIENDKTDNRPPSEEKIKALARAFGVKDDELLALANRFPDDMKEKISGPVMDFLRSNDRKSIEEFIKEYNKKK